MLGRRKRHSQDGQRVQHDEHQHAGWPLSASNLPVDQVELLVMRALSLKLIRGLLDQVDGTLRVTWVQPRVLQTAQISLMKERLNAWTGTGNNTLQFLQEETPEFGS